jgi:hypothetical protein
VGTGQQRPRRSGATQQRSFGVAFLEIVEPEAFVQSRRQRAIAHVAARSQGGPVDPALRVTVSFHPDRRAGNVTTLEAMACDGVVRSQFETGTSNGGLTAHLGGDRWRWESRIFGTAYDGAPPSERPKYGTLNFRRRSTGGSPRFGSCHLRLERATLDRATFCYPDSVFGHRRPGPDGRLVVDRMV